MCLNACFQGNFSLYSLHSSIRGWTLPTYFDLLLWCVGNVSSPLELTEEEWNSVFKTNITGTWLVSKYVCKLMRDSKRKGSIINISSIAGVERGQLPGGTAYACSKAGVNMLSKVNNL